LGIRNNEIRVHFDFAGLKVRGRLECLVKSTILQTKIIMEERWKPVVNYEKYYIVSESGIVKTLVERWGCPANSIISRRTKRGYLISSLTGELGRKHIPNHRLVAKAFIPNPENKPCVNHKNGIRNDNRVENLEWCTYQENSQHAKSMGFIKPKLGELAACVKLTNTQVLEIFNSNKTHEQLGKEYGVSSKTVGCIKIGTSWSHVTGKKYQRQRIPQETIKKIRADVRSGAVADDLCRKHNISRERATAFIYRKTVSHF
jgi:hypothetical protein